MMRHLRAFLGVALTLPLGVMLIATIYFTLFDLQWIAFLAGVLFAAVAERYHLIGEVDRWVVRNVIKWCMERQRGDPASLAKIRAIASASRKMDMHTIAETT